MAGLCEHCLENQNNVRSSGMNIFFTMFMPRDHRQKQCSHHVTARQNNVHTTWPTPLCPNNVHTRWPLTKIAKTMFIPRDPQPYVQTMFTPVTARLNNVHTTWPTTLYLNNVHTTWPTTLYAKHCSHGTLLQKERSDFPPVFSFSTIQMLLFRLYDCNDDTIADPKWRKFEQSIWNHAEGAKKKEIAACSFLTLTVKIRQ